MTIDCETSNCATSLQQVDDRDQSRYVSATWRHPFFLPLSPLQPLPMPQPYPFADHPGTHGNSNYSAQGQVDDDSDTFLHDVLVHALEIADTTMNMLQDYYENYYEEPEQQSEEENEDEDDEEKDEEDDVEITREMQDSRDRTVFKEKQ